jgi:ferric-dicitrate binding protein FerR (iron transport regulator)
LQGALGFAKATIFMDPGIIACFSLNISYFHPQILAMKILKLTCLLAIVLSLFSCSTSQVKISSNDNFEVVTLPDGSIAYMNKNSTIIFDKDFASRKVKHKGEVFYQVEKGKSPFIVITESGKITVLGTKFNVKSSDNNIEVEVESGSVELKVDKLIEEVKEGQRAAFENTAKGIKIAKAELHHKHWIKDLQRNFKNIKTEIVKESEKVGKEVTQKFKKLKGKIDND